MTTGPGEVRAGEAGAGAGRGETAPLYERVLAAMTTGMATHTDSTSPANERVPAGEPITATSRSSRPGTAEVRYHLRGNLIATRTFQADERARDVILGQFAVEKYEERYNGLRTVTGIHERFLESMAGAACVLRVTLSGGSSTVWAPYFDWDGEMANANAVNLGDAVESVSPILARQSVWDARDLPERIRRIGQPGPPAATWRELVASTTPAALADGIDAINPGLARVVFARMSAWYAQRVII